MGRMFEKLESGWLVATATYDKTTGKLYTTVKDDYFAHFSKGDDVLLIKEGSTYVAKVEETETSDNTTTLALSAYESLFIGAIWSASESEEQVLLSPLPNNKPLEKPFATIAFPFMAPEVLSELEEGIASANGLTLGQAAQLAGLNPSSQVDVNINLGNPATTVETFFADKVKAKLLNRRIEIAARRIYGRAFVSDQPIKEVLLSSYLRAMREHFFDQVQASPIFYTVTAIDDNLNVLLHNEPIEGVRAYKKDGKIAYSIRLQNELGFDVLQYSGNYTVIIEKGTIDLAVFLSWYGGSQPAGTYLADYWDKKNYEDVVYSKRYNGNNPSHLELSMNPLTATDFLSRYALVVFTVDKQTIYGKLELTQDNKFVLTKPENVSDLRWAKDLASVQSSGKGSLAQLEQGSPAKDTTLQLNVDLGNVEIGLDVFKALQDTPSPTADQLLTNFGTFKVTNAEENGAKAEVKVLTATMTLAPERWFNDANCFELFIPNDSNEMVKVVNSNGVDEHFKEVYAYQFLQAAVDDIKENYKNKLENILNNTRDVFTWTLEFMTTGGERYPLIFLNAEVEQTKSGKKFKFFYEGSAWQNWVDLPRLIYMTFTLTKRIIGVI